MNKGDPLDFSELTSSIERNLNGLSTAYTEERSLLAMKAQLNHIQKLREDHSQKDHVILLLKERLMQIELSEKQHIELQNLFSGRITDLEDTVAEKEKTIRDLESKLNSREKDFLSLEIEFARSQTNCIHFPTFQLIDVFACAGLKKLLDYRIFKRSSSMH